MRIVFCCLIFVVMSTVLLHGQEQSPPGSAKMEDVMKKWMEASSPNSHHRALADMEGKWEMTTSTWMGGGETPPMVTKGTTEFHWMLDGRFLVQNAKGEFMGRPYSGFGLTGYDNMKKCYTMFWIDNTSTAFSTAEGNYDQSGKTLILYGKMDEPTTGEHDKNVKYVLRKKDKDNYSFEVHDLSLGEEKTKIMEITYKRSQ